MDYDTLKTEISSYAHRGDVATKADTFIDLFEAYINTELRVAQMEVNITVTPTAGLITLPADYLGLRRVKSGTNTLSYVAPDRFLDYGASSANIYTIVGNMMQVNTNNAVVYTYYQKVPALSSIVLTNWLIDAYPNAYLYGCVAESMVYVQSAQAVSYFQMRDVALKSIIGNDKKARWSGAPLRVNTSNRHAV